jgi:hypothetical protein
LFHITVCQFIQYTKLEAILAKVKLAEEEAALYKRKAIIRQQTDEEQINADLNVQS